MKKYMKGLFFLLAGLSVFVACKEDDDITVGKWDAADNYANIYFEKSGESYELAPTDETTVKIPVYRRNTAGALDATLTATINTDDAFTFGPAKFADGDSLAYITVNFPKTEIGKNYTLQLSSEDPNLVSAYSKGIVYTLDIIRVKWNFVGKGYITEVGFFGGNTGEFDVYVRDDDNFKFRFDNLFDDLVTKAGKTLDGNQTKQAYVSILRPGDVLGSTTVTKTGLVGFEDDLNTGYAHPTYGADILICHPYGFSSTKAESNWSFNKVLGYQENGLPKQIQIAPFYYMNGIGGWNYTQNAGMVVITFPGVHIDYEAVFEDDFEWSDVKTFDFTNTLTGEVNNVMLQKATCTTNEDKCDSVFMATYGVPYRIKDAYAEDNDIVFFVKKKKVYIPDDEDFEDYYYQATGLTDPTTGKDIYAYIESEGSSIVWDGDDIKEITINAFFLNINYDEEEDEDIPNILGNGPQTLNNVIWVEYATGTYYYVAFAENEEGNPEPDPGYKMYYREDKPEMCKITDWLMGTDFQFTWNRTTNDCAVAYQSINYDYPDYGAMYIIEGASYDDRYAEKKSYYDPATKTFHFFPVYFVSAGSFGQYEEFFEITEGGASVKKFAPKWRGNQNFLRYNKAQKDWEKIKANQAKQTSKVSVAFSNELK